MLRSWIAFWLEVLGAGLYLLTFLIPVLGVVIGVYCLTLGEMAGLIMLVGSPAGSFLSHLAAELVLEYSVEYSVEYRWRSGDRG